MFLARGFYNATFAFSVNLLILIFVNSSYAGPPLVTDDTGIVPLGDWQVIVSAQGESRPATDSGSLPAVEVTYGFFQDMNITAVVPWNFIEDQGEPRESDFGNAQINYKWLFYDSDLASGDGLTLAISPIYSFPLSSRSRIRGVAEDVRVLSMPVISSFVTGRWEFVAQASFDFASGEGSVNGLGYGFFGVLNAPENLYLMAEVYGAEFSGDGFEEAGLPRDEGFTNWRLGLLWEFGGGFSLLAAYGGNIDSNLPRDIELDYDFFLGIQFDTELR